LPPSNIASIKTPKETQIGSKSIARILRTQETVGKLFKTESGKLQYGTWGAIARPIAKRVGMKN
jgi:hypothetical protein